MLLNIGASDRMSQSSKDSFFRLLLPHRPFQLLIRQRELLRQFTHRQIHQRHKGSFLGFFWAFLNPLVTLALFTFVFGVIFEGRFGVLENETRLDYALGIFLGLSMFHLIAETLSLSPVLIVSNPNFVKKVVFPLEVLPAAAVGASVFHFLASIGLLLLGVIFLGPGLTLSALWLPVIVLPVILLALGLGWFFSALGVFIRDFGQAMPLVAQMLMYASAIFYPITLIPTKIWTLLRFNPLLHAVDLARDTVLWHLPLSWEPLAYLYASSLLTCVAGFACFSRAKPAFADVV